MPCPNPSPRPATGHANGSPCRQRMARCGAGQTVRRLGLGIVELLCVLAIGVVLLAGALPLFDTLVQGQRLRAVADLLETDIHLARSTALRTGRAVRLTVQAVPDGGSCYLLYVGPAAGCHCSAGGRATCEPDARLLRLEALTPPQGVQLAPLSHSLVFSGAKATVTPTATLRVQARDGRAIHQVVNVMGRVRSCSPHGRVSGLRACA